MNVTVGPVPRRLRTLGLALALALAATTAACGSDEGTSGSSPADTATSAPAAEATAAPEAPATVPEAGATTAVTLPPTTVPATTLPTSTAPVTLAPTTAPPDTATPTTAPPTTAPPTTAPPAPVTTAAPIVIGGLTLATCIASEYFGFDAVEPRPEVALYQYTLRGLGYDPGAIDGYFGPRTLEAGANEIIDHTTDNAGLFIDEGVIARDAFVRLGIAC